MKLLKAINLTHYFDHKLFENISLDLNQKESIAIMGVSGSGKSTLLHILSTLLIPKSGTVEILGADTNSLSEKDLIQLRRRDLAVVFQSHYLFKGFSAIENIEVASILAEEKIDVELIQNLGIATVMNQKVSELSGGQQQRVSIARALSKKPRIIFADEPTGNLDLKTATDVMQILSDYINQYSAGMILVTHDKDLANKCDKIYSLQNQQLSQITTQQSTTN